MKKHSHTNPKLRGAASGAPPAPLGPAAGVAAAVRPSRALALAPGASSGGVMSMSEGREPPSPRGSAGPTPLLLVLLLLLKLMLRAGEGGRGLCWDEGRGGEGVDGAAAAAAGSEASPCSRLRRCSSSSSRCCCTCVKVCWRARLRWSTHEEIVAARRVEGRQLAGAGREHIGGTTRAQEGGVQCSPKVRAG